MKKYFYTYIFIFVTIYSWAQNPEIQGTISSSGSTSTVIIKPTAGGITPTSAAATAINVGLKIPIIGGELMAPTISFSSLIGGTFGPVKITDDGLGNWFYETLLSSGDLIAANTTIAINTEIPVYTATFSGAGGRIVTLVDDPNSDNGLFDVVIPGYSAAVDPDTKFYGGGSLTNDAGGGISRVSAASALPITLKTFTAERYGNARASILNWISSSEINGSHFDVERSLDAQSWSKIGTVNAVGNTTTETSYEFIDRTIDQARTNPEVVYYRLNKVDLDGSSEYTDIKIVHFEPITDVSVAMSPNPAINMLSVTINTPEKTSDVDVRIYDVAGKFVAKHTVSTNGISTIDVSNIPSGLYNVTVKMADKIHSNKIIISH